MKRPIQIVELRQPRCALRFGVGACPATGTPICYNTWATCPTAATKAVYDSTGRIRWRFVSNRPGLYNFGDYSDADDPATHGIPVSGLSISTSKSQLNVAGILEGKSPFGIHATCSVTMDDFVWNDQDGDYYLSSRSALPKRTFWTTFLARAGFLGNIEILIYDGYEGEALASMRQRLYLLESIDGPSGGRVTLKGVDPLWPTGDKRSMFPPAYAMTLSGAISAGATSAIVLAADEAHISATIGLTSGRHIVIGSEIIGYTGYSVTGTGEYTLSGLVRGLGGTTAASASDGASVGRVGHFEDALIADAGRYLLEDWTKVGTAYLDGTAWQAETDGYLSTGRCDLFLPKPTATRDLMGEVCQQGCFNVWWDEYAQKVKMQAVRPPIGVPTALDDDTAILADSASVSMEPESRLTRVLVYYDQINDTATGRANFRVVSGSIYTDGELDAAGGEPRTLEIFGRWIESETQAFQVVSRTFLRYKKIPRMLTIKVSAKDRAIAIGDALDITTRASVDTEGRSLQERWQVTAVSEVVAGQTYQLDLQSFNMTGRFAFVADNAAPDYTAASAAQKAAWAWISDSAGLMSDGTEGYKIQ